MDNLDLMLESRGEIMDLEAFLVGEIGKDKVEELKLEGCDLSQQYREGDGVLTVLNDLLNWHDSTKGYDYWYAIAHVEYVDYL